MGAPGHRFEAGRLAGILRIESPLFQDHRGSFAEVYSQRAFLERGIPELLPLTNWSRSHARVLRGLHWQGPANAMGKLVRCSLGRIYDVVLDLRAGSPTFGEWEAFELSDERCVQLWIPPGFAHGFAVLSARADISYRCSTYHSPADEGTIAWDDPDLDIPWPLRDPILSDRDRGGMSMAAYRRAPVFTLV
jgi:dTDP-4-dehydrorhamnose 3,5-epimerase